jgi:hypothetical protein
MIFFTEVTESTLNPNTSPALNDVVHPVNVLDSAAVAVVSVGLADAVIVSATVGGKFAYVSFHTSITIDPEVGDPASADNILHFFHVPETGIDTNALNPVVITAPPPSTINVICLLTTVITPESAYVCHVEPSDLSVVTVSVEKYNVPGATAFAAGLDAALPRRITS